jgi:hypothetical protein
MTMQLRTLSQYRFLASTLTLSALLCSWVVGAIAQDGPDTNGDQQIEDGIHFTPVGPITETRLLVVWDTDDRGVGGPFDMNGPRIGTVRYSQRPSDTLVLNIRLVFAHPQTTYQVFLVCGPSHDESCGFITIGELATDEAGMGEGQFVVPSQQLQAPPFGPGYRTDHIDLLREELDFSRGAPTAGALNYFVQGPPRDVAAARRGPPRDVAAASRGPLDPTRQ